MQSVSFKNRLLTDQLKWPVSTGRIIGGERGGGASVGPQRTQRLPRGSRWAKLLPRKRDAVNGRCAAEVERGHDEQSVTQTLQKLLAKAKVASISCHQRVATSLTRVLNRAHAQYGTDGLEALGLDVYGGCFNLRQKRRGTSLSPHAWGVAIDWDPDRSQLSWGRATGRASPDRRTSPGGGSERTRAGSASAAGAISTGCTSRQLRSKSLARGPRSSIQRSAGLQR